MNILKPVLLLSVTLTFASCLDTAESHYTPQIGSSYFIRNHTDTLSVQRDKNTGQHILDTITVGDTIQFAIGFNALGNNLLTAKATWEDQYSSLIMGPLSEIKDIMLETSDTLACTINLPIGYYYLGASFTYIALAAGSPTLTFTAISDSKFSPGELSIVTPIEKASE